ncbi:hypothetical protein [Pontibacter fetidus]|uniref:NlpE C-terminal OB domain-containing protein n=1 Tax=Pontibacter fetidus TaxID=2700082 RepID=A0A6B2H802_9BACT|nr:hypothetical protein [Pontibacter fetidus]NDK56657.1 hypothetical protein [Pontibacter fetidus]
MRLKYTLLACCLITFSACDKEDDVPTEILEGMLVWTGDYRADGCGFILTTENEIYKPINESAVDDIYKANSQTEVKVKVKVINYNKSVQPCRSAEPYNEIKILEIQPK